MRLGQAPKDNLNELLRISNTLVQTHNQPPLYIDSQPAQTNARREYKAQPEGRSNSTLGFSFQASPDHSATANYVDASSSFHVSIAWRLAAPSESLTEQLHHASKDLQDIEIGIQTIKVKMGNGLTSIPLASRIDTSNRIIEK